MSAPVRYDCPLGEACYRNLGQARRGLDTTRQRRLREHLPWWQIPTRVFRAPVCGRWHLGYKKAARRYARQLRARRKQIPDMIAALTPAA